ncbi:MAG: aminotransferase class V-fold PLP-dependent enzyme [Candidatus Magasanikbacteria bacterium]
MSLNKIKQKFPSLKQDPSLVYLDNAATTQCPKPVIEVVEKYYRNKSNVHRGFYSSEIDNTKKYEQSREVVADFIGSTSKETIFTSGTTESLNSIAKMLKPRVDKNENIVTTIAEHHSNLLPWQQLAKRVGCELRFIEINDSYELDLDSARKKIDRNTKIVSFSYISNVLGTELLVSDLVALADEVNAFTIIDVAQAMDCNRLDVKELGVDFLAFSGHKLFGPTGVGVLYGREELLKQLEPMEFGGSMVKKVERDGSSWAGLPHEFEAGTSNIAGVLGLGRAVKFIQNVDQKRISDHKKRLNKYLVKKLGQIEDVNIIRPKNSYLDSGISSFVIDEIHPHDVAEFLSENSICVRAGHHCAMPLMNELDLVGTVRVSVSIYNNKEDIDELINNLKLIQRKFN